MSKQLIFYSIGLFILIGLVFINYAVLMEAYGSGPPYYGRTTNMDKWVSPLPRLAIIDIIGIISLLLLAVFSRSKR